MAVEDPDGKISPLLSGTDAAASDADIVAEAVPSIGVVMEVGAGVGDPGDSVGSCCGGWDAPVVDGPGNTVVEDPKSPESVTACATGSTVGARSEDDASVRTGTAGESAPCSALVFAVFGHIK